MTVTSSIGPARLLEEQLAQASPDLLRELHDVQARQRELAVLQAELEEMISRSHDLDPADCTSQQICHIVAGPPDRGRGLGLGVLSGA